MFDDYRLRTKTLIKWYEYQMQMGNQPEQSPTKEEFAAAAEEVLTEAGVNEGAAGGFGDGEEEIDLDAAGLSAEDQDLYASIMAKFQDAKQNSVDDVFAMANEAIAAGGDAGAAGTATDVSEEDLIASICAPKQNNVDDLVKQAREQ
ncbi:hypothetical protein SAMN02910368_01999 [Lachnospiraceae bacterium G11]|nr:hypothetical protein SAMN02910368_01999 [Lachnospiraceae bacterium G11]